MIGRKAGERGKKGTRTAGPPPVPPAACRPPPKEGARVDGSRWVPPPSEGARGRPHAATPSPNPFPARQGRGFCIGGTIRRGCPSLPSGEGRPRRMRGGVRCRVAIPSHRRLSPLHRNHTLLRWHQVNPFRDLEPPRARESSRSNSAGATAATWIALSMRPSRTAAACRRPMSIPVMGYWVALPRATSGEIPTMSARNICRSRSPNLSSDTICARSMAEYLTWC